VPKSKPLDEEIRDDRLARKKNHGQLNKQRKSIIRCFGAPRDEEGNIGWQSLEKVGQVDLGFWYLGFWHLGFDLRLLVRDCNV
jgi:hypothetical protein